MIRWFLTAWLLICTLSSRGQQPILLLDSAFSATRIEKPYLFQAHPTANWRLQDVGKPIDLHHWQSVSGIHYSDGAAVGYALFGCRSTVTQEVWVEITSHFIDPVRVTVVRSDTVLRFSPSSYRHSGSNAHSPVRHHYPVFALPLIAYQTCYVYVEGHVIPGDYLKFNLDLWSLSAFLFAQQGNAWGWALFVGIVLMAGLISLLNFAFHPQPIYLFYTLYISCLTVYALINDGWGVYLPTSIRWMDSQFILVHWLNRCSATFTGSGVGPLPGSAGTNAQCGAP